MNTIEVIEIAIGCTATVLAGVWFIIHKVYGMGKLIQKVSDLPCRSHDDKISILAEMSVRNEERTANLPCSTQQNKINDLSDNLTRISALLLLKYQDAKEVLSAKHSPRKLNEMGLKIFNDAKGQEFLDMNKDYLFAEIDKHKPLAKLDVENACYAVCVDSVRMEIFNPIKAFIYNAPYYDVKQSDGTIKQFDLSLIDVCFVLSIPLRDMYLAEHTDIIS